MVAKRVNLTIEEDLHDKATSYAEDKGMSFSALVAKAISQYMKTGDHTPITSESILMQMSPEERSGLMKPIVSEMVNEFMLSEKGMAYLSGLVMERRESLSPEVTDPRSKGEAAPRVSGPPAPKTGYVIISEEFRLRLEKFGPTALEKASGIGKGDISRIQHGKKTSVSEANYKKLEAGLSTLEADASKNAVLPSE